MEDRRPSPERILESIQEQEREENSGKLKIFFGYAAGVGKTYAMLEAAHEAKKNGRDVVVGYVERHTRPDTLALLEGLEVLPAREVAYKGVSLKEFDLDGALARRPQLILVDELAHSNAQGCRHAKRYQDVEELLRAGIDVYTTVNVQHLESLNDLVASVTGIAVSERFPDRVFDMADQVELVDIEPEDLILRLQSGKVYRPGQARRALDHFFTKENLEALREIALRRTADRLSRTAQKKGNESGVRAGEHILVCLSSAPSSARVIRTAARMAEAFHSGFTALYVEGEQIREMKGDELKRLRDNIRLAEQMGAQIATVYGDEPAVQIAEYARVSGVTKIVIGRPNQRYSRFFHSKTLADQLTDLVGNMDLYIIPDAEPSPYRRRIFFPRSEGPVFLWQDLVKMLTVVALSTLVAYGFFVAGLRDANIITVYILGVLITAIWTHGHLYGIFGSFLSVVVFNYFFTVPQFTLEVIDPDYPITFLIMLTASLISSTLAIRVKKQAQQASQKAYYTELLMNSSQKLQQGKTEEEIIALAAEQLSALLDRPILYALNKGEEELAFEAVPEEQAGRLLASVTAEERGVADWVVKNKKRAGATTNTLSNAQNLYLAVRGMQGVMGVVGIPSRYYPEPEVFEKNLMIAIVNECGLILERKRMAEEKVNVEMEARQERLRANLLRAISHDLRTPLTSISGNAGVLMEKDISLGEEKKQELYRSIYDDSMWLVNLTENLLSITRIENGTMHLQRNTELVEDVFEEALQHLDRQAKEHEISVELPDDLLMAEMDVRLIVQVIINIVNNAVKYTPPGSHIVLRAEKKEQMAVIRISDDGPGIPDEGKAHLFDMFYTAGKGNSDNRRGLGLGLNLCRSIVMAHGGQISVEDNRPHGSVFTFTLPLKEVEVQDV